MHVYTKCVRCAYDIRFLCTGTRAPLYATANISCVLINVGVTMQCSRMNGDDLSISLTRSLYYVGSQSSSTCCKVSSVS